MDNPVNEIDFTKFSRTTLATTNNNSSKISISLPKEDAYICLQNSYLSIEVENPKNEGTRYADSDEIAPVTFGPLPFLVRLS